MLLWTILPDVSSVSPGKKTIGGNRDIRFFARLLYLWLPVRPQRRRSPEVADGQKYPFRISPVIVTWPHRTWAK